MKTILRTLLLLAFIVWLGAEIFFPVVAGVTFSQISDTHAAGQVVGGLLRILHGMGLVCGVVLLALLALAPAWGVFKSRSVLTPMVFIVLMLALTCYSQFVIIPAMERDRIAVGGAIDAVPADNSYHMDFNRLHNRSTQVEGAVLLFGLIAVALIAGAETVAARQV